MDRYQQFYLSCLLFSSSSQLTNQTLIKRTQGNSFLFLSSLLSSLLSSPLRLLPLFPSLLHFSKAFLNLIFYPASCKEKCSLFCLSYPYRILLCVIISSPRHVIPSEHTSTRVHWYGGFLLTYLPTYLLTCLPTIGYNTIT